MYKWYDSHVFYFVGLQPTTWAAQVLSTSRSRERTQNQEIQTWVMQDT